MRGGERVRCARECVHVRAWPEALKMCSMWWVLCMMLLWDHDGFQGAWSMQ